MINVQPNGPWKMIEELAEETDLTEEPWEMDCGRRVILPEQTTVCISLFSVL